MRIHPVSFACGMVTTLAFYYAVKVARSRKKTLTSRKDVEENCLLFSPYQNTWGVSCMKRNVFCSQLSCPLCSYRKFLELLKSAASSLDVCVYLITSDEITTAIIKLFKKGIRVRIITDKQMSPQSRGSRVETFLRRKIPLKVIDTLDIMHNKFVIIDETILATGSFNWTQQAFGRNFENAVIIRNENIIRKYVEYFEHLWMEGTGQMF